MSSFPERARSLRPVLPILAVIVAVLVPSAIVAAAASAGTFGYDFLAYHAAAERVLGGQPLYNLSVEEMGGFGQYFYPPPFVLAILPFAILPGATAAWVWLGLSMLMLGSGIALMPVAGWVRWTTLLLAGLSWPVAYALKLGQVGPLLFLLFSLGWRWLDRPGVVGLTGALGAIVKIQPGIVLAWAVLTRRWRAVVIGGLVLLAAVPLATVIAGGPSIWGDYLTLLQNVNDPITTAHNFTPGAVAYQMGVSESTAFILQVASSVAALGAVVVAALRLPAGASYLVAVVASQLLSPVLWDHYAMLLLLPVAYLLERRQWWALTIPLITSVLVLPLGQPPILYPVAFWLTIAGLFLAGRAGDAEAAARS
jgi:alpha-1,2-mannosyltransferase